MSELVHPRGSRPLRISAYAVVAVAIAFELAVVWLMLNPRVPADYRAYYIDRTTTCLNQPVTGAYELGTIVSFRSEGRQSAMPLRVCGWEGPAGDGTHAVGQSSRLRFALPADHAGALQLTLELVAIEREKQPWQRVVIEANDTEIDSVTAIGGDPFTVDLTIPAELVARHPQALELSLHFPDATLMSPSDSDTRRRSIKLLSARLSQP